MLHHEGPPSGQGQQPPHQEISGPLTLESLAEKIQKQGDQIHTLQQEVETLRGENITVRARMGVMEQKLDGVANLTQYLGPESPLHEDAGFKEIRQHSAAKDTIAKIQERQQLRGKKFLGDHNIIRGAKTKEWSLEKPNQKAVGGLKVLYTVTAAAIGAFAGYEGVLALQTLGHLPKEAQDLVSSVVNPNFSAIDPSKLSPVTITPSFPFVSPHLPDVSGAVNPMWQPYSTAVAKGFNQLIASGTNFASEAKAAAIASVGSAIIACLTHPWRPVIRNSSFVGPIAASVLQTAGTTVNLPEEIRDKARLAQEERRTIVQPDNNPRLPGGDRNAR